MATKATNGRADTPTAGDLTDQIEVIRKDLSALTQMMADLGKGTADAALDRAKTTAAGAQERVAAHAETARQHATEIQGQANDFIRNQPATALGIAAGIGFLIGMMGTRR